MIFQKKIQRKKKITNRNRPKNLILKTRLFTEKLDDKKGGDEKVPPMPLLENDEKVILGGD